MKVDTKASGPCRVKLIVNRLKKTKSNAEFLMALQGQ